MKRVIATEEELDALPNGTVVRFIGRHVIAEKSEDGWYPLSMAYYDLDWLPAEVLWTPGEV